MLKDFNTPLSEEAVKAATEHEKDDSALFESDNLRKKSFLEKLGLIEPMEVTAPTQNVQEPLTANRQANASTSSTPLFEEIINVEKLRAGLDLDAPATTEPDFAFDHPVQTEPAKEQPSFESEGIPAITREKLTTEEIFSKYNLTPKTATNTVYLIDGFMKALPTNLPVEIRRQSLISLLTASQMNLVDLLNDGKYRLETLSTYMNEFSSETESIVTNYEAQIRLLTEKISQYNNIIEERKRVLEEQKWETDFEMQKITSIMNFVRSKDKM